MIQNTYIGTTTVEEPGVVIYYPDVTTIELTCDVSPGVAWLVNSASYLSIELENGNLPGHDINGSNILIMTNPMNNSQYSCSDGRSIGGVYRIFVVGEYADLFYKLCSYTYMWGLLMLAPITNTKLH